jgi:hypothetical protein
MDIGSNGLFDTFSAEALRNPNDAVQENQQDADDDESFG